MSRPLLSRKKDLIYLIFFCIHLPVMLVVDLYTLYPTSLKPQFMTTIREFYITTYRDQFFIKPPAWFDAYMWMEALYHLPLCLWVIPALRRDDPKVPLHLLVYACQTALTTATCIADFLSWPEYERSEKVQLAGLYVPYLVLAIFMGVDMFGRLDRMISRNPANAGKKML